jgi:flagellar protein FlgJ
MKKEAFIEKYYPFAKQAELESKIPALFALAQSALESGWGKHAPGNMLFGIKVGSAKNFGGWTGKKQLISTTEYSSKPDLRYPYIYPGFPVKLTSGKWKYRIKDYFRAYPSPLNAFLDWAGLLTKASHYKKAMQQKDDPYQFAEEVAKAGYATGPNYASKIKAIMRDIEDKLPEEEKPQPSQENPIIQKLKKNRLPIFLLVAGSALVIYSITHRVLS